jgi:hypothetical protein
VAAVGRQREREVASFDEGELWCDDAATPPSNPAGWYFRERRGAPLMWIGPFADPDDARAAPFSGDPLRDARRYLDLWRRGEPAPRPALAVAAAVRETPKPKAPTGELTLDGGQGTAPAKASRAAKRRAPPAEQMSLEL